MEHSSVHQVLQEQAEHLEQELRELLEHPVQVEHLELMVHSLVVVVLQEQAEHLELVLLEAVVHLVQAEHLV